MVGPFNALSLLFNVLLSVGFTSVVGTVVLYLKLHHCSLMDFCKPCSDFLHDLETFLARICYFEWHPNKGAMQIMSSSEEFFVDMLSR